VKVTIDGSRAMRTGLRAIILMALACLACCDESMRDYFERDARECRSYLPHFSSGCGLGFDLVVFDGVAVCHPRGCPPVPRYKSETRP
jgi:hypothetical protein